MPDETRNYLPKLQALKNIVRDPEKYGLDLSDIPDAPYFAVVKMDRKIDVKIAAKLAEMPVDEFLYLNPQHNRPVIAGADEYALLLPIDKAELFAAKLQLADQPLVSWQAYRMRNGETLQQVAAKFRLEVDALRAVNGIGAKAKVPVGHALLVPVQGPTEAAADTLAHAVFTTVPQGRTFYYGPARRNARGHCRPVRGVRRRPEALERPRAEIASRRGNRCASRAILRRPRPRASARPGRARNGRRPRRLPARRPRSRFRCARVAPVAKAGAATGG